MYKRVKTAIVAWHGLGDLVMLTAPLKRYADTHIFEELHVFTLKRFGETSRELLSGLPFIKEVHPVLKDAWNDFPSYHEGITEILKESILYGATLGIEKVLPTFCFRPKEEFSIYQNKMFRFAYDLSVQYTERSQFKPSLCIKDESRREVADLLRLYEPPYRVLHVTGGNDKKTLDFVGSEQLEPYYAWETTGTTFEIGGHRMAIEKNHVPLLLPSMEFTKALVEACDRVIAIDSVVMHIAFALEKQVDAIFTMTPTVQVVPLWKDYSSFVTFRCNSPEWENGLDTVRGLK